MATNPIFVATSVIGFARPTAANTASDGTGTEGTDIFTLVTGSASGTRIDSIKATSSQVTPGASGTVVVKVFITDTNGNNPRIFDEIVVSTATRSATAAGAANLANYPGGIFLASGQKIKVAVSAFSAAGQLDIIARGGNF